MYDVDGIFILDNKNFLKTKKIFSGKVHHKIINFIYKKENNANSGVVICNKQT